MAPPPRISRAAPRSVNRVDLDPAARLHYDSP
jgi:hypothetical protein